MFNRRLYSKILVVSLFVTFIFHIFISCKTTRRHNVNKHQPNYSSYDLGFHFGLVEQIKEIARIINSEAKSGTAVSTYLTFLIKNEIDTEFLGFIEKNKNQFSQLERIQKELKVKKKKLEVLDRANLISQINNKKFIDELKDLLNSIPAQKKLMSRYVNDFFTMFKVENLSIQRQAFVLMDRTNIIWNKSDLDNFIQYSNDHKKEKFFNYLLNKNTDDNFKYVYDNTLEDLKAHKEFNSFNPVKIMETMGFSQDKPENGFELLSKDFRVLVLNGCG